MPPKYHESTPCGRLLAAGAFPDFGERRVLAQVPGRAVDAHRRLGPRLAGIDRVELLVGAEPDLAGEGLPVGR